MPNDQSHDTRTTDPLQRAVQAVSLEVAYRAADPEPDGIIFTESFDDQPDWTSTMFSTSPAQTVDSGHTVPDDWYGIYQGTSWSPEMGQADKHASAEILSSNADKARGGTGKSMVNWRESITKGTPGNEWYWASDSHMLKWFDTEYPELYVEFYIRFSENWYQRGLAPGEQNGSYTSKIFRAGYWAGPEVGNPWNSEEDAVNPRVFWDYQFDNYGVRNVIAMRSGPPGGNKKIDIRESGNYTSHTKGQEVGGTDPQHQDQINGGNLCDLAGLANHEQVFGPSPKWTKMAFYMKLNSAPGVADGIFRQWLDGHRIVNYENIPWVETEYPGAVTGFNYFAIGGNDFFHPYPEEDQFEDWYAIDDVVVRDSIPEELQ